MNKIWIVILMAFCIAFFGCKQEQVVPDPEIVTFNVLPGTSFTVGDEFTVNFEAKNAVSTENNIGAPTTTSWSYTLTATLNITNIKVSAINKNGVKVEKSQNITVVAPYIPDRTDSLYSMVWSLESHVALDKDDNIIWIVNLTPDQLAEKYYFYKDGTGKVIDKNGVIVGYGGPGSWRWGGSNIFLSGDQTYVYTLKGNKFCLYQWNNNKTETYRDTFIGVKL